MVETTRSNTELRKDVDALKESCERTEKTLEELHTMMATMFTNQNHQPVHGGLGHSNENGGESPMNRGAPWTSRYQIPTKVSRVDFPQFNGEDLREGKALRWHQMFMKGRLTREVPNWEEYIRALNDRFGPLVHDDPMSKLVNLKQVGNVQQYLDKFDEIVNCMDLVDHYALSCFLGGLKGEISVNKFATVTYKLQLPADAKIHPTCHVSQLKKKVGNAPCSSDLPVMFTSHGFLVLEPETVLDKRVVPRNNKPITQWLMKWFNAPIEESTWEFLHDLRIKFPHFEDKDFLEGKVVDIGQIEGKT
ncbi:hypothetical protein BUALT_Bualt06G0002700 [Buddleja alternifolia]|uniref:Retrotransposon gag domain-containing protein n=1 Tax=Buddleja alternifolia TaxID=168488 RepID=A0AAV6XJF3_9LAMI|nr:hypothetical protein BUALT_Bualt06G0002700 [Buddleja alternifolia]